MEWFDLKKRLLAIGKVRMTGKDASLYMSSSTAGPGAGGPGSVFFSTGKGRVRLSVNHGGPIEIVHLGSGEAVLKMDGEEIEGYLDPVALHCPRQAFITVSGGCIYRCRYCEVPGLPVTRKTIREIDDMVRPVADRIDAISITSGVLHAIEEEEDYVLQVIRRLVRYGLPLGVSIFPGEHTAGRLFDRGVAEVKFNVETATQKIFDQMCPGLDWAQIWQALDQSVPLFGQGHVFSNLIIGLGETDREAEACIRKLCDRGVIPVLRPLNPAGDLRSWSRPSPERLEKLFSIHKNALKDAGLDTRSAVSMCIACTGCDLVPGKDDCL